MTIDEQLDDIRDTQTACLFAVKIALASLLAESPRALELVKKADKQTIEDMLGNQPVPDAWIATVNEQLRNIVQKSEVLLKNRP